MVKLFDDNILYTWTEAVAPVISENTKQKSKQQTYYRWRRLGQFPNPDIKIAHNTQRYTGGLLNSFYANPKAWQAANKRVAA